MNLNPEIRNKFKTHLALYGLADLVPKLDAALDVALEENNLYSVDMDSEFLNSASAISCQMAENADGDFVFRIINPTVQEALQFSASFPQMLPSSPWGIADTEALSFPHLASAEIQSVKWTYLFFSTEDETKQAELYSMVSGDGTAANLDALKEISGTEISVGDDNIIWVGGLFYEGDYEMPWDAIIPADLAWASSLIKDISVSAKGCVFQQGAFTKLKMQVPLFTMQNPFGDNVVKKTSLTMEFSSSLLFLDEAIDGARSEKRIGLIGQIQFQDDIDLAVTGSWPIDGDEILLGLSCKLTDISNYFNDDSINGLSLPEDIEADLTLSISKTSLSLEKIIFDLGLDNWEIAQGIIGFSEVNFGIRIYDPASLKLLIANFVAKATLGESVNIICNGNYPDGDLSLGLDPDYPVIINDLISVFVNADLGLPDTLLITDLSGNYNYNTGHFSLILNISDGVDDWKINGDVGFKLNNISFGIYGAAAITFKMQASFSYFLKTGKELLFTGGASYDDSWIFNAGYTGDVSLTEIGDEFGFSALPSELEHFSFTELSFVINESIGQKYFSGSCMVELFGGDVNLDLAVNQIGETTSFSGTFAYQDIAGRGNEITCDIDFTQTVAAYESSLILKFPIAGHVINLAGTISNGNSQFAGETKGLNIDLTSILDDLLPDRIGLPVGFLPALQIQDISITYTKNANGNEFCLSAVATIGRKPINFFIYLRDSSQKNSYALGLTTDLPSLTGLPMVGENMKDVQIKNLGFVYASEKGTWCDGDFEQGLSFTGELILPNRTKPVLELILSGGNPDQAASGDPQVTATSSSNEINKAIGPFWLSALGFAYEGSDISIVFSGGVNLAGLTVSVEGLGLSFELDKLLKGELTVPSFSLDGLGLGFKNGPVAISGMFLREASSEGGLAFSGGAVLKAEDFTISGVGSYKSIGGDPSLFIFALYEGALGGPAFFFVEGLAAGFGYNRKVKIPQIEEVQKFPFVKMAIAPPSNPNTISVNDLSANIMPSIGDYWLAIGVKFNSFKLVDSFALLIASFNRGGDFRMDILGISKLVFPVRTPANKNTDPIAEVRMAFHASFVPSEGFLGVKAQLIEGSYILSKECVLTGGFAFYSWFDGPYKGDFVQTMGGYHPSFKKPAHYPSVPRLAFNWNVSSRVTIKGSMYFALTPSMTMAGGRLEATYHKGSVKAWFIVGADFLISWEPFFYDVTFRVRVGAEYKKDCGLFDIKVSVDVGAKVHIWGPEMRGTAAIDLGLFTVNVSFGADSSPKRNFINWSAFKKSFLPADNDICNVFVNQGLITTLEEINEERWIINAKELIITTDSVIPLRSVNSTKFGIEPMGLTYENIEESIQTITLDKEGPDGPINVNSDFNIEPVLKNIPKALWNEAGSLPGKPSLTDTKGTINNMLSGYRITPAKPPVPGSTKIIDKDLLAVEITRNRKGEFDITNEDPVLFEPSTSFNDIADTIDDAETTRTELMRSFSFSAMDFDFEGLDEDCFMNVPMIETAP